MANKAQQAALVAVFLPSGHATRFVIAAKTRPLVSTVARERRLLMLTLGDTEREGDRKGGDKLFEGHFLWTLELPEWKRRLGVLKTLKVAKSIFYIFFDQHCRYKCTFVHKSPTQLAAVPVGQWTELYFGSFATNSVREVFVERNCGCDTVLGRRM